MSFTANLRCMIEIPKGSRNKYEYDPALQAIVFDRFVSTSVVYPTDYGFVPETLAEDGDALDVLVCVTEPTFPGCIIPVRMVALLRMRDEKGRDDKLVAVPESDPNWDSCHELENLPEQLRAEIQHFFTVYKDLDEERHSETLGWAGREAAAQALKDAQQRYRRSHPDARAPRDDDAP